jgi:hypothetical protein
METPIRSPAAIDALKFCLALVVGAPLLLAGCCPFYEWSEASIEATEKRGDSIIAALEAYRAQHGEYPKELQDLIPQFAEAVEPPLVGDRKWVYIRLVPNQFDLSIKEPESARELYYWSYHGVWGYRDRSF